MQLVRVISQDQDLIANTTVFVTTAAVFNQVALLSNYLTTVAEHASIRQARKIQQLVTTEDRQYENFVGSERDGTLRGCKNRIKDSTCLDAQQLASSDHVRNGGVRTFADRIRPGFFSLTGTAKMLFFTRQAWKAGPLK